MLLNGLPTEGQQPATPSYDPTLSVQVRLSTMAPGVDSVSTQK